MVSSGRRRSDAFRRPRHFAVATRSCRKEAFRAQRIEFRRLGIRPIARRCAGAFEERNGGSARDLDPRLRRSRRRLGLQSGRKRIEAAKRCVVTATAFARSGRFGIRSRPSARLGFLTRIARYRFGGVAFRVPLRRVAARLFLRRGRVRPRRRDRHDRFRGIRRPARTPRYLGVDRAVVRAERPFTKGSRGGSPR